MHRGEIWWADLPASEGSEPGFRRPVLIVQANPFNRSMINTIIAVALTGNLRLGKAPGNVFLPSEHTDLPNDSVANVSQVVTIDKAYLDECVGVLSMRFVSLVGSPYKTVQVNNFNKLHIIASGSTYRKIRCLQSNTGRYFQTCIAL
ncbi:MAG: type II toxin-antitoxin system PemK/MazF family toxin [Desulfobacteraceae bacterium]|nr:type II toxin-antitoxin system PemK/MazF family toxin [Desulfobacteraceae bacterium]